MNTQQPVIVREHAFMKIEVHDAPARKRVVRASSVYDGGLLPTQTPNGIARVDWPRIAIATYWSRASKSGAWRFSTIAPRVVLDDAPLGPDTPLLRTSTTSFFSNERGGCLGTGLELVNRGAIEPTQAWWMSRFSYAFASLEAFATWHDAWAKQKLAEAAQHLRLASDDDARRYAHRQAEDDAQAWRSLAEQVRLRACEPLGLAWPRTMPWTMP